MLENLLADVRNQSTDVRKNTKIFFKNTIHQKEKGVEYYS